MKCVLYGGSDIKMWKMMLEDDTATVVDWAQKLDRLGLLKINVEKTKVMKSSTSPGTE